MIVGKICDTYNDKDPIIKNAITWLGLLLSNEQPETDMRYEGENGMYAILATLETKPLEDRFESHKKYVDVHYVFSGEEVISYAPETELQKLTSYDDSIDTEIFCGNRLCQCLLKEGMFAVFFPGEPHQPGGNNGKNGNIIRKIIIKIPYNL